MQATAGLASAGPVAVAGLPRARGPLTEGLFEALRGPIRPVRLPRSVDGSEDDLQLALYCCYELHYRGFSDVATEWEWEPSLLAHRRRLEAPFEEELAREVAACGAPGPHDVVASLWELALGSSGPSLSAWMLEHATWDHVVELAKHRSAYQLKEADPHTWAIPRLSGAAKAVMVAIQSEEYGDGSESDMHATLFAETMRSLGLDPTPNRYLDELPARSLATTNLITFLGLHRRWRGALVGHLALFEMTSSIPMGRYGAVLSRLDLGREARRFYDVHVEADERHRVMAAGPMVVGLLSDEPELGADVVAGARALQRVEARFTAHLLECWESDRSSLRAVPGER